MSRLPLRLRLTLVFTFALAVVLAGFGAFVYVRLADSLLEQVDAGLAVRADALAADLRGGAETLDGDEESFAQLLAPDGSVIAATPGFPAPLLSPGQRAAAAGDGLLTETVISAPGEHETEPARLLVRPLERRLLVVVASLEDRADALGGLLAELLLGGPIALLLASAAGYLLAGATLRPVEAMRRRAAEISADTSGERLPVSRADDEIQRLGTTLNAMLDRLDAGLRRERRFVADAGHELRTPLALLKSELELALRRPRAREELERAVRSASIEVDRLSRLANDLLVLASSGDGRLPLRLSRFAVCDLVEVVAGRFSAQAAAAGREVAVECSAAGEMDGDRLRLEQALGNLVGNPSATARARSGSRRSSTRNASSSGSRTRAGASRRGSSPTRSSASRARTRPAPRRGPASAWRSSLRSPARTAARLTPGTPPTRAPSSASRFRPDARDERPRRAGLLRRATGVRRARQSRGSRPAARIRTG
jgi:two-component system OmpR family sensor kinase